MNLAKFLRAAILQNMYKQMLLKTSWNERLACRHEFNDWSGIEYLNEMLMYKKMKLSFKDFFSKCDQIRS